MCCLLVLNLVKEEDEPLIALLQRLSQHEDKTDEGYDGHRRIRELTVGVGADDVELGHHCQALASVGGRKAAERARVAPRSL